MKGDLKIFQSNVVKVGNNVDKLAIATKKTFDRIEKKMATKADLDAFTTKITSHFDVVAENIHQDVAGANKDEISFMKKQQLPDHEKRIQVIEKRTGDRFETTFLFVFARSREATKQSLRFVKQDCFVTRFARSSQ